MDAPDSFSGSQPGREAEAGEPACPPGIGTGHPRILLAATLRWPLAARLAIALHALGCRVDAWCPVGHPLEKTRAVERIHRCSALSAQRSLRAALRAASPDFVLPCDDDAALLLHRIHRRSDGAASAQRRLIERSLGVPAACALATDRGELMRIAAGAGVRVPASARLSAPADIHAWAARSGFPAVLKVDRTWGGLGVAIVNDIGAARSALRAAAHPSLVKALSHLILRRDPSHVLRRLAGARAAVTLQAFVAGTPANRAVACWQGEVLAGISVMALQTRTPTGPATVVQVIDHPEMTDATTRLVRALGLSGLCGLDFVIEAGTGAAYLIEVNPRATPISHLALGPGRDLPAALHARLRGEPPPASAAAIRGDVIAMFPGEWCRNPLSPFLRSAFHDVPWAEIELVRDCVDLPWEDRGVAARLRARLDPKRAAVPASFPHPARPPGCESPTSV